MFFYQWSIVYVRTWSEKTYLTTSFRWQVCFFTGENEHKTSLFKIKKHTAVTVCFADLRVEPEDDAFVIIRLDRII